METTAFSIGVVIIQFYGTLEIIKPFLSTEAGNLGAQMPSAIARPTLILQLGKLRPLDRNRPSISLLGQKPVLMPPNSIVFPLYYLVVSGLVPQSAQASEEMQRVEEGIVLWVWPQACQVRGWIGGLCGQGLILRSPFQAVHLLVCVTYWISEISYF